MHSPCPVRFRTSQRNSPHSCFHLTGELFCKMKKQILQGILPNLIKSGTCLENLFFWSVFENCFPSDVHHTLREIWPGCAHTGQICIKPACVSGPKTSVNILQVLRIQLFACIGRTSAEHCILRHLVYGTEIALPVNPIFLQCRYLQCMA